METRTLSEHIWTLNVLSWHEIFMKIVRILCSPPDGGLHYPIVAYSSKQKVGIFSNMWISCISLKRMNPSHTLSWLMTNISLFVMTHDRVDYVYVDMVNGYLDYLLKNADLDKI
jgi:hypothetical protein